MIEIDSALSSYLQERLNFKKDLYAEISSTYPLDLDGDFSNYANLLNNIYGSDICGATAADALYAVKTPYGNSRTNGVVNEYDSWIINSGSDSNPIGTQGLLRTVNQRNKSKDINFAGVSCLILDSIEKFNFWFVGDRLSGGNNEERVYDSSEYSLEFPDLTAIIVLKDPIPRNSGTIIGSNRIYRAFLRHTNMPNLKIASSNLSALIEFRDIENIEYVDAKEWLNQNNGEKQNNEQ